MSKRLAWLTPLVAVAAAGCFATSNDIKILQSHIDTLQQTVAAQRADADRARLSELQRDSSIAMAIRALSAVSSSTRDSVRTLSDSVRVFMDAFSRFKADVALTDSQLAQMMYSAMAQLGASQKQIAEMQRGFDTQREARPDPADTVGRGGMPGPTTLYQIGFSALQTGGTDAARGAFEDFIKTYPDHKRFPDAVFQLAETYARERNENAADSLYKVVTEKYPKSQYAATALWKRAEALGKAGQPKAATALYTRIVNEYPGSDVYLKAKDRLKLPPE